MPTLSILGNAVHLPPLRSARDLVLAAGGVADDYRGWPTIGVAGEDDHPADMDAKALSAALERSEVAARDLSLVISGGMSRDFAPSWSVSTEVMRLCGASDRCLGIDLTVGCLGGLAALDYALGWLALRGGGHAAIVCSERWAWTVERQDPATQPMWGIGDGAAATVVGLGVGGQSLAEFVGAEFCSHSDFNGYVRIKYGGTRFPQAPPGTPPSARELVGAAKGDVRGVYLDCYGRAIARLKDRFQVQPTRLICNQISAPMIESIAGMAGVPLARTAQTGSQVGHIGSADLQIGLQQLLDAGQVDGPVMLAASTPYVFGAGLLRPA